MAYGYRGYLETNYGGKVWIRSDKKPYRGGLTSNIYAEGMYRNVATFYQTHLLQLVLIVENGVLILQGFMKNFGLNGRKCSAIK